MAREKVGEVKGDLGMEGFVSEEKEIKLNLLWDKEPVDGNDVVMWDRISRQQSSGYTEVYQGLWRVYHNNTTAVVESAC